MEWGAPVGVQAWPKASGPARAAPLWEAFLEGFGFGEDPFDVDYVSARPGLQSEQSRRTVGRLADGIGSSAPPRVLLVGPEGSGRTLFMHSLAMRIRANRMQVAGYIDARAVGQPAEADQVRLHARQSLKRLLKTKGVVLIDNADGMFSEIREPSTARTRYVLGISPHTYSKVLQSEGGAGNYLVHSLAPLQGRMEIEELLRSLVASGVSEGEPFDEEAYEAISSKSMGLPGLATELASASLWVAGWIGATKVTRAVAERVSEYLHYGVANGVASGSIRLNHIRAFIVNEALGLFYTKGDIRRNDLATRFRGTPGSVLEHHLSILTEQELLSKSRYGHRVRYDMPRPVRAALQIL